MTNQYNELLKIFDKANDFDKGHLAALELAIGLLSNSNAKRSYILRVLREQKELTINGILEKEKVTRG